MSTNESTTTALPKKDHEDPIDALARKSAQLFSMLITTYGEGFESFNSYNDEIKENYLWACSDLALEIRELSAHIACNAR